MLDYSTNIDKLRTTSVTDDQASAASNFTDQTILQSDIKDIKKLTSEEVQLLKSLGQEFSRTATQSQFRGFRHLPFRYIFNYLWIETYP